MSGERARQRNLRNQIGDTAAAAVVDMREQVQQIALAQRVLAGQMLEFERTVATVRESRAADRKAIDEKFVDFRAALYSTDLRVSKLVENLRIEHARTVQFESMGFWRRLRWNLTGARPPFYDPVNDRRIDASPQTAYPGDGL